MMLAVPVLLLGDLCFNKIKKNIEKLGVACRYYARGGNKSRAKRCKVEIGRCRMLAECCTRYKVFFPNLEDRPISKWLMTLVSKSPK